LDHILAVKDKGHISPDVVESGQKLLNVICPWPNNRAGGPAAARRPRWQRSAFGKDFMFSSVRIGYDASEPVRENGHG
jgi:hypothetical protein